MKIQVPMPQKIPKGRGMNSTASSRGTSLRTRCVKRERAIVQAAAEKCGVTESEFIRWVCVHAAEFVNAHD